MVGKWGCRALSAGMVLLLVRIASAQVQANLSITKTDAPDPASVGALLTYTIVVQNAGPGSAPNVLVTDQLPLGATFSTGSSSQGNCSNGGGTITCNLGTISSGNSANVIIAVLPSMAGPLTNTVQTSSDRSDPNLANNTATATTQVLVAQSGADLGLTKTAAPEPVITGANLTYTIVVTNNGSIVATNVRMTDRLPAGLTFVSASLPGGSCQLRLAGTLTCDVASLDPGESATMTVVVRATQVGSIVNTASVAGNQGDPNPANNAAMDVSTVLPLPQSGTDLSVTKTDAPDPVAINGSLTYQLGVTNAGPDAATGVVVEDMLPVGVTFVSAVATQGACTLSGRRLSCSVGGLARNASAGVTVLVMAGTSGTLSNTVTVSGTQVDPNPANNTASVTTTVGRPMVDGGPAAVDAGTSTVDAAPTSEQVDVHGAGCECEVGQGRGQDGAVAAGATLLVGILLLLRRARQRRA